MDIRKLIGDPQCVLPDEVQRLVADLLAGDVVQLAFVYEHRDGSARTQHSPVENDASLFKLIGMVEVLKDGLMAPMREQTNSDD